MLVGEEPLERYRRVDVDPEDRIGEDGRPVPPEFEVSTIHASIQPLTAWETQTLPEGERVSKNWWLFTEDDIRLVDQHSQTEADVVKIDGRYFEAREMRHYRDSMPIPHYQVRVLALRENSTLLQHLP